MGYYSEETLSRTADDAELDRRDELTPPATRPITLAIPTSWPAPAARFGETVYLRHTTQHAWRVVGMRFEPTARAWMYELLRDTATREEAPADELARTPWCRACEAVVATTVIAGERYCAECAELRDAENQPF